jgi:conjugative relaxase-like TrwC/TraI family protein
MLTISKPLSAGQAMNYHQKEFTAKEQNYWSQRGEVLGEWQGKLATHFGLAGAVSAEDFARLSQGQHPATGEQLVRQRASYEYKDADGKTIKTMEHRAGWDATFSAPKSVSLTALVGQDERVRSAHRESVHAAMEQLENYTQARIGGNHPPESTGKFIAAEFEHDTARPVDGYAAPQLHTHAVIFNITERENGQYRALQPQSLFASQQFATAIYQSELTYRLRQLGYEISTGRSGAPEIKGYTQEYLDASSPRSQQIRAYLERTGRIGKEAAEIAAHSTRDKKEIHSLRDVMAAHRALAAEFGHQAEAVVRAAQERIQHQKQESIPRLRASEALAFSRDKNFEREAVIDEGRSCETPFAAAWERSPMARFAVSRAPPRATSFARAPDSTTRPLSRTCMMPAYMTDVKLWVIMRPVLPAVRVQKRPNQYCSAQDSVELANSFHSTSVVSH